MRRRANGLDRKAVSAVVIRQVVGQMGQISRDLGFVEISTCGSAHATSACLSMFVPSVVQESMVS